MNDFVWTIWAVLLLVGAVLAFAGAARIAGGPMVETRAAMILLVSGGVVIGAVIVWALIVMAIGLAGA